MKRTHPRLFLAAVLLLPNFSTLSAEPTPPTVPDVGQMARGIVSEIHGVFNAPPRHVPASGGNSVPDGPLAGNGDIGLVLGGPPDRLRFYIGKADFFGVVRGGIMPVGSLALDIPSLRGASYRVQQNIGPAHLTGTFTGADGTELSLTSWVAATKNLVVLEFRNTGSKPLPISSQLLDGWETPGNAATFGANPDTTWLLVSPDSVLLEIGNRLHGAPPNAPSSTFSGQIADVRIYDRTLALEALAPSIVPSKALFSWQPTKDTHPTGPITLDPSGPHGGTATFQGDPKSVIEPAVLLVPQERFTITAWVQPRATDAQNVIVSALSDPYHPRKYPFQRGVCLSLIQGKLSATLNQTTVTAPDALPLNEWTKVAATYDGKVFSVFANGKLVATTRDFPTADAVMGFDQEAIHFGAAQVPFQGNAPQGLMVQRIIGALTTQEGQSLTFTVPAHGRVSLILSALTDRNTPNYADTARQMVAQIDVTALTALARQHHVWWDDFWARSYVQISDTPIRDEWYASLYLLACCSKAGSPPPGLWGNFITQRQVGWQGDYTLNYNMEAPEWAAYATNHLALADNYEQPLLDYMPRGRAIAAHYGYAGLFYYTHLIPLPGWDDDPSKFLSQKSGLLFGVLNCVMRWRYTQDLTYARKIYPLLRGTADFWDKYLKIQNGRYVDLHDGAWEGPETQDSQDTNPATTLAFLHALYPALIEISQALNVDAARRSQWNEIGSKLSPLTIVPAASIDHIRRQPVTATLQDLLGADTVRGKWVIRATESGAGFPVPGLLFSDDRIQSTSPGMNPTEAIFPGGAIGLESGDRERQAALDTVTLAAEWYDFNNNCTFYPSAAAAGVDPKSILQHLNVLIARHSNPNFAFSTGGGGTENDAIVPATLSQMFLQSYQKNLHLFPNWPADHDAAFGNLAAYGGFLISSQIQNRKIIYIQIKSTAGQECRVVNPWPGVNVLVSPGVGQTRTMQGTVLRIPTKIGETITLWPIDVGYREHDAP